MSELLLLGFVLLVAGVVAVPIATRLGLGSVLGYLMAGMCISPVLTLLHVDVVALQHFAEFGVVMMLFLVGLELEPKVLWAMRKRLLGLGGGQVVATIALISGGAMALGQTWQVALAIGCVLSLSSTAIVLQTLNEKGLLKSDGGQASFAVLLFQDIAVIPMLALLPLLAAPVADAATQGGVAEAHSAGVSLVAGLNAWQATLVAVGAIGAVIVGGNHLTRPLFRFVASAGLRELFTATALLLVMGIALLMTAVGLSPALGTFLAGVVLANSEYRHELESDIDPFRGLLLGLFFITVGAGIDFTLLGDNLLFILGLTAGVMVLKASVLYALGFAGRVPTGHRWLFALGLAQAGEFGFVLLSFTVGNHILPKAIADQLLLVVALSMMLTPLLFIFFERVIAPVFARGQDRDPDAIDAESHIIIAGHGRVGGIVNRMLRSGGHHATVIDYSSRQLDLLRKFGVHAYFGDATRPDLLTSAQIMTAKLLIIAIDDRQQINVMVEYVHRNYPHLHVIARAVDRSHVYELWARGCRDIIRETYDSSLRMGRSAYEALGASRDQATRITDAFNQVDRAAMVEVAGAFDITIPTYENELYIAKVRETMGIRGAELEAVVAEILAEDAASGS